MKPDAFCKALAAAALLFRLQTSCAPAATWYISPAGSDSNSGTSTNAPLATITGAQTLASSGDIVYIMAGTYYPTNQYPAEDGVYVPVILINKNGITYEAMPGTRPVFNFSLVNPPGLRTAAFWVTATGVTFQGFDVVGVQENITGSNNQSIGIAAWGSSCTWNKVNVHDADCVGFYLYSPSVTPNNLFYRCDSYNNAGINSYSYGNADGFGCHPSHGSTNNILRECRAWNNSDDGYDCINAAEPVTFDHCWSFENGNNGGNGNGFKIGGWASKPQDEIPDPIPAHVVFNCLAADNLAEDGFYMNHQPAGPGAPTAWTNNTSYDNPGGADFDMLQRTPPDYSSSVDQTDTNDISGTNVLAVRNLAFGGTLLGDAGADETTAGPLCISNSWSVGYTLSAADFVDGKDWTQMTNARAANGALPVMTFMHLVPGDPLSGLGCFVVPPAPTGVAVAGTNTQVSLTWKTSPGAYAYNVYRSITNGGPYTNIALWVTNNSYLDANLGNGSTYYSNYDYVVTAVNPGDESSNSAQVSIAPFIGPLITAASVSPDPALPGQSVTFTAAVMAQANPIATVTVDVSAIGGLTNQILVSNGDGGYTNSVTVSPTTPSGVQPLTVNATDTQGNVAVSYPLSLTVGTVSDTWDGGGSDENWSDATNWVGNVAPGSGYTLIFDGVTGLAPLMDSSYDINVIIFDSTAGAFTIGTTNSTLTLSGGLTNNSANLQTLNVPVVLGGPVTVNAATAGLTLGQTVNNGGNLLTITGGGYSTTVDGAISGAGGLAYFGTGANMLLGVNTFGGNLTIGNGALVIVGAGQLGGGAYSGTIADSGTLTCNSTAAQTLSGVISGTGALNQNGPGPLTLSAANTFSGPTTITGGTLQLSNSLALQDSPLIYTGGNVTFSGITAATLGGLTSTQNLSLVNTASAGVALTIGGHNASTIYSGVFSGSGASLTQAGTGALILTGDNSYSGATTVADGVLQLNPDGVINGTSANVDDGAEMIISGGSLTASALSNVGGGAATGLLVSSGSATFNGGLTADLADDSDVLIKATGGSLTAASLALGRSGFIATTLPAAGSTADGLYVNGGTVNIKGNLNMSSSDQVDSSASARIDSGVLTIDGTVTIGLDNSSRWSVLDVNGGTLTLTNTTTGVSLGGPYAGNAELLIRNGNATIGRIGLGYGTVADSNVLNQTGGSLYVGSGGIAQVSPNALPMITLIGGILGATANWSSSLPMTLGGTTIQAADASGSAHNISLSGTLSGTGNLVKTGAGTLTLSGTNTYAGTTTISGGILLANNTIRSATGVGTVTVASGGTLGGTGIVASAVTVDSGGALVPGNPLGTLTLSNNLTLAAGSTTFIQVQHSPLTNSAVKVTGALIENGALIVTNSNATAFAGGDSFKLLNAASYSGAFTNFILRPCPRVWSGTPRP